MSKWYTISCAECGGEIAVHQDWDKLPKYCRSCKEARAEQWHEVACADCGAAIRVHRDWDKPPKLCKPCKERKNAEWYESSCAHCGGKMRINRNWENASNYCKACLAHFAPREVSCRQCGKYFKISTRTQVRCMENHWELPSLCQECKHDALLIKGAIGALRDTFPFALVKWTPNLGPGA